MDRVANAQPPINPAEMATENATLRATLELIVKGCDGGLRDVQWAADTAKEALG